MKKKKKHTGLITFIVLIVIVVITVYIIYKNKDTEESTETATESKVEKKTITKTIQNSSSISSALTENLSLHTTYYFSEIYVATNQSVKKGDNILKYTNGTYMTAPYDGVITSISVPEGNEICSSKHYVTIKATDTLQISLNVAEDEVSLVSLGQEASITVDVYKDEVYKGYVTSISSTASYSSNGSYFTVVIEFQNDGNILLGMSASCDIILEKAENVLAVPKEAVTTRNGKIYVTVKNKDGTTNNVEVQIGISNDAYTEITSGLEEGQTVIIVEEEKESSNNMQGFRGQMPSGFGNSDSQTMPSMPSGNGSGSFDEKSFPSNGGQIPSGKGI